LPPLAAIAEISREIAFEVGRVAMEQGLALEMSDDALRASIERNFWKAEYRPYKRVSI
jgi:malate dehydrogenase (oxaloacetate-decarboxylating)